jgi:hypothetical protein
MDITKFNTISPDGWFPVTLSRRYYPFSQADKTYVLNWLFKYSANFKPPPSSFLANEGPDIPKIDKFGDQLTEYKLFNHFRAMAPPSQPGYSPSASEARAVVGNTMDPCRIYDITGFFDWIGQVINGYPKDGAFVGKKGPYNALNNEPIKDHDRVTLIVEGTPDDMGLRAFRTLTGYDQGTIWSTITFFRHFSDYKATKSPQYGHTLTRPPIPRSVFGGRINTQTYPTYWIYVDGTLEYEQIQASQPSALFPNLDIPTW